MVPHYPATPQLWTSLVINIWDIETLSSKLELLRLYLLNAKNLSFSLELNFTSKELPLFGPTISARLVQKNVCVLDRLAEFYRIIFEPKNAERIKVLWLRMPLGPWPCPIFGDLPRPEALHLFSLNEVGHLSLDHFNAPRLNKIIAMGIALLVSGAGELVRLDNVTVVNLFRTPLNKCLGLLTLCQNLVEFRARASEESNALDGCRLVLSEELVLSKLRVLEWTCFHDLWNTLFLKYIRAPGLRTLVWSSDAFSGRDEVVSFFRQLPHAITNLELSAFIGSPYEMDFEWNNFQYLPNVTRLILSQCSLTNLVQVFEKLELAICLPALAQIYIAGKPEREDLRSADDNGDTFRLVFREMVEARWEGFRNGLKLNTEDWCLGWGPEDGVWVCKLVGKGLKLEIFEDGHLVEGLFDVDNDDSS